MSVFENGSSDCFGPRLMMPEDLLVQRQRQQQLGLQRVERAPLVAPPSTVPTNPRRRTAPARAAACGAASTVTLVRRNRHVRRRVIPQRVRRLKRAAAVEENRDARHVQRLGDPRRHGLEERSGLDHRPDLHRQLAQDRVGLVGLAEEPAIHPAAKPIGEPAADRHDRDHAGNDRGHAREAGAAREHRRRGDGDRRQERDLNRANPAAGQQVLQPLPDRPRARPSPGARR